MRMYSNNNTNNGNGVLFLSKYWYQKKKKDKAGATFYVIAIRRGKKKIKHSANNVHGICEEKISPRVTHWRYHDIGTDNDTGTSCTATPVTGRTWYHNRIQHRKVSNTYMIRGRRYTQMRRCEVLVRYVDVVIRAKPSSFAIRASRRTITCITKPEARTTKPKNRSQRSWKRIKSSLQLCCAQRLHVKKGLRQLRHKLVYAKVWMRKAGNWEYCITLAIVIRKWRENIMCRPTFGYCLTEFTFTALCIDTTIHTRPPLDTS